MYYYIEQYDTEIGLDIIYLYDYKIHVCQTYVGYNNNVMYYIIAYSILYNIYVYHNIYYIAILLFD